MAGLIKSPAKKDNTHMPTKETAIVASELVPRNRLRKSMIFSNESAADSVFIKRERAETPTVTSTDHDHRIGPGGILTLNFGTDGIEAIQDRWTVIASANTPRIAWFETEDVVR